MGRPSSFTQEAADAICDRLAMGESLRTICKDEDTPELSVVIRWLGHPDRGAFRLQYAHARTLQGHLIEDELLEIVDDTTNDTLKNEKGTEYPNTEWISRSRLRYEARKWVLTKLFPKKYGEKLDVTSGGKPIPPIQGMLIVQPGTTPEPDDATGL